MHGLSESVPRVRLIEIGPEQSEEGVPPMEPSWSSTSKVGQEREALGTTQHRCDIAAGVEQVDRTEQMQLEHYRDPKAVRGPLTAA